MMPDAYNLRVGIIDKLAPDFAALHPGYFLLDEFQAACDKSRMVSRYVSRDEER